MAEDFVQLNQNTTVGAKVKTFTHTEGAATVHVQGVAVADPSTGDPVALALEATQSALKTAVDNLLVVLAAIRDTAGIKKITDTVAVIGPITDAQLRAAPVRTLPATSSAVRTNVAGVDTDVLLLEANGNRKGALIFNDSNSILHIGLGNEAASLNSYTFMIAADTMWEIPLGFTGEIRGIWVDAGGFARITELT